MVIVPYFVVLYKTEAFAGKLDQSQPGPNRPSGAAINQLTARKSTAAESHCLNSFVPPLKPPCRTAYRSQRGLQPPTSA